MRPYESAKTVATGCADMPLRAHGKEGVDGSSPSEGFTKRSPVRQFGAWFGAVRSRHRFAARTRVGPRQRPEAASRAAFSNAGTSQHNSARSHLLDCSTDSVRRGRLRQSSVSELTYDGS